MCVVQVFFPVHIELYEVEKLILLRYAIRETFVYHSRDVACFDNSCMIGKQKKKEKKITDAV